MIERRRIVEQWKRGGARVLVTLVRAEGSSYRRPGARMLVGTGGAAAGTISGGCLEAEVVRKAEWMVAGGAVVERYSTMFDDTAEVPFGLGCGGVVDLLLEPVETPESAALFAAMEASLSGDERFVATWLPGEGRPLRRAVFGPDGALVFASSGLGEAELREVSARGVGALAEGAGVFVETIRPPQRLFVLGAGDDAKPVVTMAALLGWGVTVAEGRPHLARAERFPEAERVIVVRSAAELGVRTGDAVVLMTHSYEQDRMLLAGLISMPEVGGYIGVLGARHRSSLLVSEAAALAGLSVAECCERVWAPVGLDLGGDGPEAIALAVVAEVQAWVQGRLGSSRRLSAEAVAAHVAQGGAARYAQAQCAVELAGS
jgi:xanthine/CO dehydrogenase XdhC/CoxF family maturation factor